MTETYNGNPYVKADGVQQQFTKHEISEYVRCMKDVAYFCENYVKVISLDKGLTPFVLRGYQKDMVKHFNDNRFSIVLACRQSGKCSVGETEVTIKFLDGPPLRAKISLVHEIFYALSTLQKSLFYKYKRDLPKEQVFKDLFLPDGEAQTLFIKLWREASYFSKKLWWKQFRREPSGINFKRAFCRSSFIGEDVSKRQLRMEEHGLCPSHDDAHTRWHKNKILTFIRKCSNQLHKCFIRGKQWREKSLLRKNARGSSKGDAKQKSFGRIQKEYLQENEIYLGWGGVSGENEKPENKFGVIEGIHSIRGTQRKHIKRPEETSCGSGLCITEQRKGNIRGNEEETLKGWKGKGNIRGNEEETLRTTQREEVNEGAHRKDKNSGEKEKEGAVPALWKDRRCIRDVEVAFRQLPSTEKFIESFEGFGFVVETDRGFQPLKQSHKTIPYTIWEVKTECGKYLRCADDHILFNQEFDEVFVKDLKEGSVIQTKDGGSKVVGVQRCGKEVEMYDLGVDFTDHRFYTNDILSHNSITSVAWLLHYVIFNPDKKVGILANKGATAREMLGRLTLMLENLPFFLQPGCKVLNKGSIKFSNNSEIIAAATSGSSIRGLSLNCIFLDEFGFVNNANEFYTSTYPVISSGADTKVIITSTPNGVGNMFYKLWEGAIQGANQFKPFTIKWRDVPGRDEAWKQQTISNTSEVQFKQEFDCSFLGSTQTLIDSDILLGMQAGKPIKIQYEIHYYEEPQPGHEYVLCADVSKGRGQDYSTFSVIDISQQPFKQVCTYRNNTISPLLFPNMIVRAANIYNKALVIIENNDAGMVVCNSVYYDYEYENTFTTSAVKSNGIGVTMSRKVKRIGCSNLKDLIEGGKLQIVDPETIIELSSFEPKGDSYAGADGTHDDSVMNLVLFAWFVSTDMFQSMSNVELKDLLYQEKLLEMEEDLPPFGFMEGNQPTINSAYTDLISDMNEWNSL